MDKYVSLHIPDAPAGCFCKQPAKYHEILDLASGRGYRNPEPPDGPISEHILERQIEGVENHVGVDLTRVLFIDPMILERLSCGHHPSQAELVLHQSRTTCGILAENCRVGRQTRDGRQTKYNDTI